MAVILAGGCRVSHMHDGAALVEGTLRVWNQVGRATGADLAELLPPETEVIAAPELGAILLGGAVSLETGKPLVLVRKEAKEYGTSKALEGRLEAGQKVTVVEDVLTTGGEAIKAAEKVRAAGGEVLMLVAVLDREEGAADNLRAAGLDYQPLFRKSDLPLD